MPRRLMGGLLAIVFAFAAGSPTLAETVVTRVNDHAELNQKWCEASPEQHYIFIMPASLFVDSEELFCNGVPYKLYRVIDPYDSYDFEYNIDPPFGKTGVLGCGSTAGRQMDLVAVNCGPT